MLPPYQTNVADFFITTKWNITTKTSHLTIIALLVATTAVLQAQNCSINWFTIDGGGRTSTGGVYAVTGIPQCGTNPMPARWPAAACGGRSRRLT